MHKNEQYLNSTKNDTDLIGGSIIQFLKMLTLGLEQRNIVLCQTTVITFNQLHICQKTHTDFQSNRKNKFSWSHLFLI